MSSFPFSQGPLDTEHPWACLCQVDMFQTVPDTSSYVKVRHHRLLDQVMFEGQFGVLSLKTVHSEMILNVKTFSKPLSLFVFKTSVSTPPVAKMDFFLCWFYAPVEIFKCYLFFVLFSKSDTCSLSTYRGAFYFSSRGKSLHVYTVKSVLKCGSVVCVIYQTRLNFFSLFTPKMLLLRVINMSDVTNFSLPLSLSLSFSWS